MSRVLMDEETERRLLANDPSLTSLRWNDRQIVATVADCERAALALGQSTHVETLSLSLHIFDPIVERVLNGDIPLGGLSGTVVGTFAKWMKSSKSLRNLTLSSNSLSQRTCFHVLPHFLSSIWMRRHSYRRGVDPIASLNLFNVLIKADDLVMLLRYARVRMLSMDYFTISKGSFTKQEAIHKIAQSFASNSSITTLSLDVHNSYQDYFVANLTALKSNKFIQTLDLRDNTTTGQLPMPVLNAILDHFRTATCPIKAVVFDSFKLKREIMTALVQALKASPMPLKVLQLRDGSIDTSSCAILQTIFESDSTIDCLFLDGQVKFPKRDNYQALSVLIGTSPGLKEVRMQSYGVQSRRQIKQFQAIMHGLTLTSCAVAKVDIRKLPSCHVPSLMNTIPYLQSVKAMAFRGLTGEANGAVIKRKVMTAFRRNRSVLESNISWNVLDQSDRARLQTYHERNTHLGGLMRLVSGDERTWDEKGALLPSLLGASVSSDNPLQCVRDILGSLVAAKDLIGVEPISTSSKRQAVESPGIASAKRRKF